MSIQGSDATATSPSIAAGAGIPSRQQIGLALSLLGKDVLAYHPRLSELTGSIPAGLLLSQSLYWTRMLLERNDRQDGWFWKTQQDWQRELALSKHEQATARRHLSALPFWHEQRRATHGRLHYRIDLDLLANRLDSNFSGEWSWQDRQQMLLLLGRPVLVFRPLADLCHSVTAAILLSHFLNVERYELRTRDSRASASAWRTYQFDPLKHTTGLSRAELNHARKVLVRDSVVVERLTGAPPRAQWRVNFPVFIRLLRQQVDSLSNTNKKAAGEVKKSSETRVVVQFAGNQQSGLLETSKLEKPAFSPATASTDSILGSAENCPQTRMVEQFSRIRETEDMESGKQKILNPGNITAGFETVCFPDSGLPNKGLTTVKTTTTPTPLSQAHGTSGAMGGGGFSAARKAEARIPTGEKTSQQNLIEASDIAWPNLLLPDERLIAERLLAKAGRLAQVLLDELAGQHAMVPIRQPLAYLRKLSTQVSAGTFVPSAAPRVAAQRAKRQRDAEGTSPAPAPGSQALSEDQREARRLALANIRKAMFGGRALQ